MKSRMLLTALALVVTPAAAGLASPRPPNRVSSARSMVSPWSVFSC
jgi:hypothetical protein